MPRRPRGRYAPPGRRHDALGIALIALAVTIVVGTVSLWVWVKETRPEIDETTLCPMDGPRAVTVVLIDVTDPYSPVQREAIRRELADLREATPRFGAFGVYSVGPTDEEVLKPSAWLCNPGHGDELNRYYENVPRAEKLWREGFQKPIEETFDRYLDPPAPRPRSPILESLQSVAVTAFAGNTHQDIPKKLVVVSDMLQHTDGLSHYRELPTFDEFRAEPYWLKVRPRLDGVAVEILYARRDGAARVQGAEHVRFWQELIADAGARLERVLSI